MLRNQKGFTLIELIVIIVVIGILAAVAIPRYVDLVNEASNGTARGVLGGLRSANSLLFASRIITPNTATFGWTQIVGSAQLQGVDNTFDATNFTLTVGGGNTYVFTLNPTNPAAPGAPAVITCATTTW